MKEQLQVFAKEIDFIKDNRIKNFTIKALEELPEYFWEVPASSTGKYHPTYALGTGGLSRHVKSAVRIANELFNLDMWKFNDLQKDIIFSALFLHDGCKSGIERSEYTVFDHPLQITNYIKSKTELCSMLSNEILETICKAIESHMGQWCSDKRTGKTLPKPENGIQKFVHMCDYLASRKCIEMNFDV